MKALLFDHLPHLLEGVGVTAFLSADDDEEVESQMGTEPLTPPPPSQLSETDSAPAVASSSTSSSADSHDDWMRASRRIRRHRKRWTGILRTQIDFSSGYESEL